MTANTVFSLNSSPIVPRKCCHLVAIRTGMNKMAEGDEYLDYCNETLEQTTKSWHALLGAFLNEMAEFELTLGTIIRG